MGTEGMKYSLVSREVIADSMETVRAGQTMDAVIACGGCDKNMPGAMIAFARLDLPAIFVYGGTIKPGRHDDRDLTVVSVFEAVGAHASGRVDDAELHAIETHACPGRGSCGGMFTANTMSNAIEAMGLSLPGSSTMAAEDAEKSESAAESARVLVEAILDGRTARQMMTRESFLNAIAVVMAVGGSTNAVLHLLAIAHAAGVKLSLRTSIASVAAFPCCAISCRLGATRRSTFIARAGSQVMKILLEHALIDGSCPTVSRQDGARCACRRSERTIGEPRRHSFVDAPVHAGSHLAILSGTLAPGSGVANCPA